MDLEQIREKCGVWDEELLDCDDEFPDECPYHEECQKDARSEDGE